MKEPPAIPTKFKRGNLKVQAECLVQSWHMINVLSLFFRPLTFRTWSREKEVFSVPTSHLWISPHYAFIPTTTWLYPSSFLSSTPCGFPREEWARMVPSKGGGSTNVDPQGSTRPHSLLLRQVLSHTSCLAPYNPQVQWPPFCFWWNLKERRSRDW